MYATGARDGDIHLWDLRVQGQTGPTHGDLNVRGPVKSIRGAHTECAPVTQRRKISSGGESQRSVTAITFLPDCQTLVSAGVDPYVKLWDIRMIRDTALESGSRRWIAPEPKVRLKQRLSSQRACGFSSLALDSTGSRILATSTDHRFLSVAIIQIIYLIYLPGYMFTML